ncbi:PAS domain-containing protein [Azospirillum rugosum]|uniref:histidine kinase n=1 Tax=Azospirillum rugosum TaxID=416170 RepID=A0ABS4SSB6_9PROT|nr:PAS domain-containing protein [Azospirillum rugosum]MBP2295456.1 PAS domain S-box-containing protein [Azospirillum rugosum]MDQ0528335.1 PAS domain S-box-containing protein [Azospirillum rugosum]
MTDGPDDDLQRPGPDSPGDGEPLDVQGGGQSAGLPAAGEHEGHSVTPLGNPGVLHWQKSYISRPGLEDRSSVFFAAVEMTRMPMVVADARLPDQPIVFVNRAFLDMTLYEEEEILGRNCRFLQGAETDPDTVAEVRNALREQRAIAVDILNYKRDGTPFWNALFIGPVFDESGGEQLYWFASQVDITQRRTSERSMQQAQKMEAIGQLTAGLAHDFNNLLQVIAGNLELAATRTGGDDLLKRAIENADRATQQGAKLTQHLLAFARKQRLDPKRINLNTLIVEFSDMLLQTMSDDVDLRLDLKPGLPSCTVDPVQLEMALLNVLINARDAIRGQGQGQGQGQDQRQGQGQCQAQDGVSKGGRVTVATATLALDGNAPAHHLSPGQYVVLCVHDDGPGMEPEVLRRATEPFFTTKEPGTGLGLSMVHGFVQQSNGRLEIESEAGSGTTVRMLFPVDVERAVPPQPDLVPQGAPAPDAQTILLVEDSDDVRGLAEGYLRGLGYRVLSARSGEEALAVLEARGAAQETDRESVRESVRSPGRDPVDLLFTDLVMPGGMSGLVLVQRVRERFPDMPVLLTTGYTDELASNNPASNNAASNTVFGPSVQILNKPYRRTELADRIRATLNSARSKG